MDYQIYFSQQYSIMFNVQLPAPCKILVRTLANIYALIKGDTSNLKFTSLSPSPHSHSPFPWCLWASVMPPSHPSPSSPTTTQLSFPDIDAGKRSGWNFLIGMYTLWDARCKNNIPIALYQHTMECKITVHH